MKGSLVTYSYKAKETLLGVDEHTLIDEGAVSEKVVRQMVKGTLQQLGTDYAVAVSGYYGAPTGAPPKNL